MTRQEILALIRAVPMRCADCLETTATQRKCPEGRDGVHAFETDDQAIAEVVWSKIRPRLYQEVLDKTAIVSHRDVMLQNP